MAEALNMYMSENNDLYTEMVKNMLNRRIIILNQEISDALVEDCTMYILQWNIEDIGLPKERRKPITVIINSPGGDAYTAMNLVDVIENSDTPIRGVAMGLVASAAYYIYISCHMRYAFKNTVLLQHDGSITVSNSSKKARETMDFFSGMEDRTKQFVLEHTKMSEEFYDDHYESEFYFYPDQGKELGIVDNIIGIDVKLDDIFA